MVYSVKISKYCTTELYIEYFEIREGEAWCFIGTNTSGISNLVELFSADEQYTSAIEFPGKAAVLSFARQQEIFEAELRKDDSDFLDRIDPGTSACDFIENIDQHQELITLFNLQHCLVKGYRQLSSGESRKLMLLNSLSQNPDLIIFENPYDGLDAESCLVLDAALAKLPKLGLQILVTVNNPGDIPQWCTHLAIVNGRRLAHQGMLPEILQKVDSVIKQNRGASFQMKTAPVGDDEDRELVHLRQGFAKYGTQEIFSELTLKVTSGQHTLITGPNGSGKSTLLQIITGDNHNCYANDLKIFGIKRGTGESIWDLKRQMGIVSPDLHRNYYIPGSALQVVLSGFFDSIGVYRQYTTTQKDVALHWLDMIGLAENSHTPFRQLSYAMQRLCLIARALIKMPRLLILDEPTQGLDLHNRHNLLDFLDRIAREKVSTILYATHRRDEFRDFFRQHIDLSENHIGKTV